MVPLTAASNHREELPPFSRKRKLKNVFYNTVTKPYNIIVLLSVLLLVFLIVIPLLEMLTSTFLLAKADLRHAGGEAGEFTLFYWARILLSPVAKNLFWIPLGNSLLIAFATTLLAIAAGAGMAWLMVRTDLPAKKFFSLAVLVPYMLPSWTLAMAWLTIFRNDTIGGAQGFLGYLGLRSPDWLAYGPIAIVLVLVIHYYAYAYLLVSAALRSVNSELEEMGEIVGASKKLILQKITLPLVLPAILSAVILTFSKAMGTFGVPSFLGLKVGYYTISTSLYAKIGSEKNVAFCISLILILLAAGNIFINQRLIGSRRSYATIAGKGSRCTPLRLGKWKYPLVGLLSAFLLVTVLLPLGILVYSSFMEKEGIYALSNFTAHYWIGDAVPYLNDGLPGLFKSTEFWKFLGNTLKLVAITSIIGTFAGQIVGYINSRGRGTFSGRLVEQLVFIPYLIPSIAFGAMYLAMFSKQTVIRLFGLNIPLLPSLYGSFALIVLISVVKHLPFASRAGTANMIQISTELEEAGQIEGARFLTRFRRIIVPLSKNGFMSGLMLILISIMKELDLIVVLMSPAQGTLSYMAYTYTTSGFPQSADAVAVVMFVLVFVMYGVADKVFHADITKGL